MQTEIAEILNNMREENQRNIESFEKLLVSINTKLEVMDEDNDAVDLVRFYIAELKKAIEDRFSASMIKYDEFQTSFEGIIAAQSELAKTSELKELFDVFSKHNGIIVDEISSHKNLLDVVDAKLSQVDEKICDKEQLSSLIQDISFELSVLGENIQKTLFSFEESLKSIDVSEKLNKVSETVDELKSLVSAAPDYSGEFESLENRFENILTQNDFANFRTDLADFVQKIIDNSSSLNFELSNAAERVLNAVNSMDNSDLKNDLSLLKNCLEELKQISYKESFEEVNGILADIQDNVTNLHSVICSDIKENDDNNYNALKNYIEEISSLLTSLQDSASVLKTDTVINREKLYELTENINKFEPVDYSYDLQNIVSKLDDISNENVSISEGFLQKFENIKELVESLDNSEAVKLQFENFERIFTQIITAEDFQNFKTEFAEFIQENIDNSNAILENLNSMKCTSELLDSINVCIKVAVEKLNSDFELNFGDLKNSFEKLISEITEMKQDFDKRNDSNVFAISSGFDNVKVSLENLLTVLNSMCSTNESICAIDEKINRFNDVICNFSSDILLKQDEIVHHINDFNDIHSAQIKSVSDNIDSLKGCIDEGIEAVKNYLDELEISSNNLKNASDEKITGKLLDLESTFVHSAAEYEQKLELLQTKISEFAHIVENSNSDTEGKIAASLDEIAEIKGELVSFNDILKSSKFSMDEKLSQTVSLIDAGVENIIFSINNLSNSLVNNIDSSVKENFSVLDEKFDKLASIIEDLKEQNLSDDTIQNIENKVSVLKDEFSIVNAGITQTVQSKTDDIIKAFDTLKTDMNSFNEFDFDKVLADLKEQLEVSFMNFTVDIHSDFVSNSQNVVRLEQAFKEAYDKLSLIEECINDKIQNNNIEQFQIIAENGIRDIKHNFEGRLEEQISELKDYFDVALNNLNSQKSLKELKDDIFETSAKLHLAQDEIKQSVNELSSKLDVIVSDTSIEELQEQIDELLENKDNTLSILSDLQTKVDVIALDGTIKNELFNIDEKVSGMLSALHTKVDTIAASDVTSELSDKFEGISETEKQVSDMLSALHIKVDALAEGNSDFDILEEIEGIKEIIFEQRKFFEVASDEKAAAIDKYLRDVLLKLDNVDMEKNADDIKDSILNALVSLVDQISFVEETEEIKDFVEERTDEINKNLIEVQNQLKQLTNSDDDFDYKYSLQDVETDIAKLRLAISNMSGNDFSEVTDEIKKIVDAVEGLENSLTQEQIVDLKSDIEKLNEDIVSISSRTNKLLLTSDESYKALTDGLNNFSNVVYKLEDRINYLDNTEISERIERKIDNIHTMSVEAINSNKVSHQVMMYLGEWIDSAGENISVITEKTAEIDNIKESIQELKDAVPEKSEILNVIEKKFEQQEERLDRLEMKLEKILSTFEEKDDTMLNRKVDNIEKLLSAFGKNVEKLASYVDEE